MKESFGKLPSGQEAFLYTISCGQMKAVISDFGATLIRLYVPDSKGHVDDVILGFGDVNDYRTSTTYLGATVGRSANRIRKGQFQLDGKTYQLPINNHSNNLHSGPDSYAFRIWDVVQWEESSLTFKLFSPDGDQGFPGNAEIYVTYALEPGGRLHLTYRAVSDRDTVFNLTNHTYFNLFGHTHPEKAMDQLLMLTARFYTFSDEESVPTGEERSVDGTPFDFRTPKAIGRDINEDYDSLKLQGGYDHNFEAFADPCAILSCPETGRTMAISTDCPGLQFYSGNFLSGEQGKDGVSYCYRGGIALETQYFPNSINIDHWKKPICKAGEEYKTETVYTFNW